MVSPTKQAAQKRQGKADHMDRVPNGANGAHKSPTLERGRVAYEVGLGRGYILDGPGGEDAPRDLAHRDTQFVDGAQRVIGGTTSNKTIAPVLATIDELVELERRGDITAEVRQSGERFRELFHNAGFNPNITVDYTRERVDNSLRPDVLPDAVERAQAEVRAAMGILGGDKDSVGLVVWDVIGRGEGLASWVHRRKINIVARGATLADARRFLIQGLERLDAHFRPASESKPERVVDGSLKDLARLIPMISAIAIRPQDG